MKKLFHPSANPGHKGLQFHPIMPGNPLTDSNKTTTTLLSSNNNNANTNTNTNTNSNAIANANSNPSSQQPQKLPWLSALSSTLKDKDKDKSIPNSMDNHINTRRVEEVPREVLVIDADGFEIVPREPEGPRPSAVTSNSAVHLNPPIQIKKGVKFQAYKSTRPDLLIELNKSISDGLHSIALTYPHLFSPQPSPNHADHLDPTSVTQNSYNSKDNLKDDASLYSAEKLRVYAAAFQRFIDESTLYQKFLQETKDTYDSYVIELLDKLSTYNSSILQTSNREIELSKQLVQRDELHLQKVNKINERTKALEARIQTLEMEKSIAETESSKAREHVAAMRKEYDEMKGTCVTLTNGLSRMEDEHRNFQTNEVSRLTELSFLRASEQKLNEEIERLQQVLQNMEHIQTSMVNQDVVTNLESTVDSLRAELKRLEGAHRQLLIRYAGLKGAVDDCFKKFEKNSLDLANDLTPKVTAIIEETASLKSSRKGKKVVIQPAEKIMQLMENGGHPKIIIEVLLDHITSAPSRQRQNIGALDNDRDGFGGQALPEGHSNKIGSVQFEAGEDGATPAAEEFRSPWSHFDGQGYSEPVPSYLKFHGKIQNLYLSKRETIRILQEIWEAKVAYDHHLAHQIHFETSTLEASEKSIGEEMKKNMVNFAQSLISESLLASMPINPSMTIFFEQYLADKFKNKVMAIEMAYNILDALKRFSALSDCRMFSAVLDSKLPMEIWLDQRQLIDRIKDEIQKEIKMLKSSNSEVGDDSGKITSEQLIRLLRRILSTKSEHAFSKLTKALTLDNQSGRYINPREILSEDDQGNRSHFLEQLKLQHINEAVSFEKQVIDCIDQFADSGEKEMTVAKFRDALSYADPNKSRADVNKLLARGCGATVEEILLMEAKRIPVSIEEFKKKLRTGLLQKSAATQGKK